MKTVKIPECFVGLVSLMIIPLLTKANDGKPVLHFNKNYSITLPCLSDTLPPKVKSLDIDNNQPVEEIIKAVPKARKQAVPIPVTLQVKPVINIKPKIIKPIIKVLH